MQSQSDHRTHRRLFPDIAPPIRAALFAGFAPPPPEALDPAAWNDDVIRRLARWHLAAHGLWLAQSYGVDLTDAAVDRLESAVHHEIIVSMRLRTIGAELQELLRRSGIASVGVKGVAVADLHRELPRFFGDIDLLVDDCDYNRAIGVYRSAGYTFETTATRWSRRFAGSVNLSGGGGREVDVQRAVKPWCWGRRLSFDELLARSRVVDDVRVVGVDDALVSTALAQIADAHLHGSKLLPWRDLVVLGRQCDPASVNEIARTARLATLVSRVIAELPDAARPRPLHARLSAVGDMSLMARARFAAFADARSSRNWLVTLLRGVPAGRLALALPSLAVLPAEDMSLAQWWRHGGRMAARRCNQLLHPRPATSRRSR